MSSTRKHLIVCLLATLHGTGPLLIGFLDQGRSQFAFLLLLVLYWTWGPWAWFVWRGRVEQFAASVSCLVLSIGALLWITPVALVVTIAQLPGQFHI